MKNKSFSRKVLSYVIALAMIFTTVIPAGTAAVYAGESNSVNALNTQISGDIGSAAKDNYVTGMTEDASGNLIVMGTAKSKVGTDDPSNTTQRVFLKKYSKNDLDNPSASAVIIGSAAEDIEYEGYVFAQKEAVYYAGDSTYNGAVTTDAAGNIYVAVTEKATTSALYDYYSDLAMDLDCICYGYGWDCDDYWCDYGDTTDCEACNAFREFNEEFTAGATKGITVYKFDSKLKKVKTFQLGSFASSQSGTIDDPWAHGISVDASGNIYVGGSTKVDLGFDDPVKAFDHEDFASDTGRRGYVAKINSDMTAVTASTYIAGGKGGNYSSYDSMVNNLAVDGDSVYVIGKDQGGTIETGSDVLQPKFAKASDAYIAKLSTTDLGVTNATYFGGTGSEEVSALKVENGFVYVGGDTTSADLPVSENAAQKTINGGTSYPDGFVLKVDTSLKETEDFAASYLNCSSNRMDLFGLDVDSKGNIYVTGSVGSSGGMSGFTTDGSDTGYIFTAKYNEDASAIAALSLIGKGGSPEAGRAIAVDGEDVYLTGQLYTGSYGIGQMFVAKYNSAFAHAKVKSVKAANSGSSSSPKYCGADTALKINVAFDANVKVEGTPSLELNLKNNGVNQEAVYTSGSGTKTLVFEYTVKAGDTTDGQTLDVTSEEALKLNGGSIIPAAGGTADDVDLSVATGTSNLAGGYIYVKTTPAKVVKVTSAAEDTTYGAGAVLPITVELDDVVKTVTGTPELKMNSGGTAVFTGINSTDKKKLDFEYTVGAGDSAADLDYAAADSLTIPEGAAITDNYGTAADVTLPEPGTEGSISAASDIVIDKNAVIVESLSIADEYCNKAFNAGKVIPIEITFSQNITTTGNMELNLNAAENYNSAKAIAEPVTDTDTVVFYYTVASGESLPADAVLDYSTVDSLVLAEGATVTSGEKAVSLYLPKPGSEASLTPYKVVIDNAAPVNQYAATVTGTTNAKNYKAGEVMTLKFQMSEDVFVKEGAEPYIEMNYKTAADAAENNRWTFDRAEGQYMYFTYTVKAEDSLKNGNLHSAATWKIVAEPGDVTDAAGNSLDGTLKALSSWTSPLSGIYFDSAAPVWAEGAVLTLENVEGQKNIKITRPDAADEISGLASSSPYTVYRQKKGSDAEPVKVTTLSSYTTTYTDTGVAEDTTYIYTLTAADKCGNVSTALAAEITTTNNEGVMNDTEAPYWDEDAFLTVTRTTESTAVAEWDKSKAHDVLSQISKFNVYVKSGLLGGWELIGTVAGDQEAMNITGLELDEKYTFKVEAVDDGRNAVESTTGPQFELEEEFPMFVIRDTDGTVIRQYLDVEFSDEELTTSRFSSLNNYGTREYYAVTGIDISDLLKKAGIGNYTYVNLLSNDMASGMTFTKAEVEGEGYYYFPPAYDNVNVKATSVKPMIAFWYGSAEAGEPDFTVGGEGLPRLIFGQTSVEHINKPNFAKDIYYVTVNQVEEAVNITESENYTVDRNTELPTVTAVKEGSATVSAKVDGSKFESETVVVTMLQMRGNKLIDIASVEKSAAGTLDVSADFELQEGDIVKVVVTDALDGEKGSAAKILNGEVCTETPEIAVDDIYLRGADSAVITGTAAPSAWVSVKVTDEDGNIVYFNGEITDSEGNFALTANVEDAARPLDLTVTSGNSVKTVKIAEYTAAEEAAMKIDAVADLTVTEENLAESKAVVEEARAAYDALDENDKLALGSEVEIPLLKAEIAVAETEKAIAESEKAAAEEAAKKAAEEKAAAEAKLKTILNLTKKSVGTVKYSAKNVDNKKVTLTYSWKGVDGADSYKVVLYRNGKQISNRAVTKTTAKYSGYKRGYEYTLKVTPYAKYDGNTYYGKTASVKVTSKHSAATLKVTKKGNYRIIKSADRNSTGYQVYISKSKKFDKNVKKVKFKTGGKSLNKKVLTKNYFKEGTNYIKVRAYTTYNGKTVYGSWSTVKKVVR